MNFTEDWFTHNIPNFEKCMGALGDSRSFFLEIGSYEGRSTCWLLQNGLASDGVITCIDPFYGKNGFQDLELLGRFEDNTFKAKKKNQEIYLHQGTSYNSLSYIISEHGNMFDFIYIDGNHAPDVVLTDACLAWGTLRRGGVMLFDDYEYPHEPTKCGIDGFLMGFVGKYDLLLKNYQLAVVKK